MNFVIFAFGLSCDACVTVPDFLGLNFHTILSSGEISCPASCLVDGVLEIKSESGMRCGIGVAGFEGFSVAGLGGGSDNGVFGLYTKL